MLTFLPFNAISDFLQCDILVCAVADCAESLCVKDPQTDSRSFDSPSLAWWLTMDEVG